MTPRTLLLYLLGNRRAIEVIAADRRAIGIGLLFVLSAGLAREYDGADLVHEPWHLLVPLAASMPTSFLLFLVLFAGVPWGREPAPRFWAAYRSFLGLFWMTAPLAWLYAIPFERFLDPYDALIANLATLGVVALWRVLLMIRVGTVLHGGLVVVVAGRVLLVGDALVTGAIIHSPGLTGLIPTMAGIRGTPADQLLLDLTSRVFLTGAPLLPVLLGFFALTWCYLSRSTALTQRGWPSAAVVTTSRALPWLAVGSVLIWLPLLSWTQPEQANRYRADHLYQAGDWAGFFGELSAHRPEDYPPGWLPPPRRGLLRRVARFNPWVEILEALARQSVAPWVRQQYLERFNAEMRTWEQTWPDASSFYLHVRADPDLLATLLKLKFLFGEEMYLPAELQKDRPP